MIPLGNRLLVKPDPIETKTKSGIVINYADNEKLEKGARMYGTVVAVGPLCWFDFPGFPNNPWCVVGDRISWAKYAGTPRTDPDTQEEFIVMNDEDVLVKC